MGHGRRWAADCPSAPIRRPCIPLRGASFGVFAEFETNLRRERQLEGIAKAKADGVYRGGKRRIDRDAVFKLRENGKGPTEIAEGARGSRIQVSRILDGAYAVLS